MTLEILGHAKLRARAMILWGMKLSTAEIAQILKCEEAPVANYLAQAFDKAHADGISRDALVSQARAMLWSVGHKEELAPKP